MTSFDIIILLLFLDFCFREICDNILEYLISKME